VSGSCVDEGPLVGAGSNEACLDFSFGWRHAPLLSTSGSEADKPRPTRPPAPPGAFCRAERLLSSRHRFSRHHGFFLGTTARFCSPSLTIEHAGGRFPPPAEQSKCCRLFLDGCRTHGRTGAAAPPPAPPPTLPLAVAPIFSPLAHAFCCCGRPLFDPRPPARAPHTLVSKRYDPEQDYIMQRINMMLGAGQS